MTTASAPERPNLVPGYDSDKLGDMIFAHERSQVSDMAEFARTYYRPVIERLLPADRAAGSRRVLVLGSRLSVPIVHDLSDWAGPDGRVDFGPSRTNWAAIIEKAGRPNLHVITDDQEVGTDYDVVLAWKLLYSRTMTDRMVRDARLEWVRGRIAPGGRLVMYEMDMTSWNYFPPAPAAEALRDRNQNSFSNNYTVARDLPRVFTDIGLAPTIEMFVAPLKANSWLGRKSVSRAEALIASGAWEDPDEGRRLIAEAREELADPNRWISTPTNVFAWADAPESS